MSKAGTNHEFFAKLLTWLGELLSLLEFCINVLTSLMCKGVAVRDYIASCNTVVSAFRNSPGGIDFDTLIHTLSVPTK